MVARDTAGLVVPIGLPLLILVMGASSASDEIVTNGRTALDVFVLPLVLTMVIATIGIINMPSFLAYYRRTGILRRLSVTPASPIMVLIAQVVVSVIQAIVGLAAALAAATLAFGANPPIHSGVTLGVFVLAMTAMYAIGMIVASVAPTPNSAVAIGLIVFFALGALGGMFGGRDTLPEAVATVGNGSPSARQSRPCPPRGPATPSNQPTSRASGSPASPEPPSPPCSFAGAESWAPTPWRRNVVPNVSGRLILTGDEPGPSLRGQLSGWGGVGRSPLRQVRIDLHRGAYCRSGPPRR